jgi:hypothetical protein
LVGFESQAMCPGLTLLNVDLDNYKIEEVDTAF